VELADITQAAPYLEMGVKHFCIGWDVRILHEWWRVNGAGMRAMLEGAAPAKAGAAAAPARESVTAY
jgi:4-hydroxy-2-oxoheptanedioate aldolase